MTWKINDILRVAHFSFTSKSFYFHIYFSTLATLALKPISKVILVKNSSN